MRISLSAVYVEHLAAVRLQPSPVPTGGTASLPVTGRFIVAVLAKWKVSSAAIQDWLRKWAVIYQPCHWLWRHDVLTRTRRKGTQLALLTLATLYPGMSGCKVSNSILITRETGKTSMIHHNRTRSWQQEIGQEFLVELPRRLHV